MGVSNRGSSQGRGERDGGTRSAATDLESTETQGRGLLGDLSVGTHTRCPPHVHTDDSKSLPSPAPPPVQQGTGTVPFAGRWGQRQRDSSSQCPLREGCGVKGLKIEANLTTPMTTTATTVAQQLSVNTTTETRRQSGGGTGHGEGGTCRLVIAYLPPGSRQAAEYSLTVHSHLPVC